ncbi:acyl transferase [Taibaiella lutea]|uniref:Acyl transferase n=1 Tax=Taibaiella lutea TaxID=2608001 RepID=A0A5M6CN29_9BACT|nr:acyl transferase [Taibaiella lutea]KAA5534695.1 acyl transferase [Taibaiella lutea]
MYINIEQLKEKDSWLAEVNDRNFEEHAIAMFHFQYVNCIIYREFVDALRINPFDVNFLHRIPFLPISFFKTHEVMNGFFKPQVTFESSGTTGMQSSKHYLKDTRLYEQSFMLAFEQFYGEPDDYVFLCLLPSYLERGNSSLVFMADALIKKSRHKESGFYLDEWAQLAGTLQALRISGRKAMLLGVTFALLDFAEKYPMDLEGIVVMETGGMKGRREEWTREQVHAFLKQQWSLKEVHSEYGMTELLSQAYSIRGGLFKPSNTMRVFVRDENDPLDIKLTGTGCLNVIDLANLHSCSFIATDDIARLYIDNSFEVMGRLDHSALRGCSLMVV